MSIITDNCDELTRTARVVQLREQVADPEADAARRMDEARANRAAGLHVGGLPVGFVDNDPDGLG